MSMCVRMCACAHMRMCACVCACVRACVRVRVHVCMCQDIKKHLVFDDDVDTQTRSFLLRWLDDPSTREGNLRDFLLFITSSRRPKRHGDQTLTVIAMENATCTVPLPTSHACFQQLVLPWYANYGVFKEKLDFALEYCSKDTAFHCQ